MQLTPAYRVITFVPPESVEGVLRAVKVVDPLRYGDYAEVSWRSAPGTERFLTEEGAHPTLGAVGRLTDGPSVRIEFSVPRQHDLLEAVVTALLRAHPWEEPVVLVHEVQDARGIKKLLNA
ncbi:hypothetical protein HY631_02135 [Candidatus Uhrbacteria bacterium]|nr:hypothetical protein [Candidatus Uhrbacteria bacterium]